MRTFVTASAARPLVAAVTVTMAGLLAVGLAAPARAGGATSVLLVVPGGGGTAALYYDDPEYAELSRLVGADSGSDPTATTGGGDETASTVTVTWLIHDVQVFRVDRIYLGGPDGPWVASQVQYDGNIWDAPVSWHRPTEPKALLALLERLGLDPTGGSRGRSPTDAERAPQPAPVTREAASTARPETAVPRRGTPWLLLTVASLAGALVAVAVTLPLARRTHNRAAAADATAADDHVAAGPKEVDADDAAAWSPTEELWSHR